MLAAPPLFGGLRLASLMAFSLMAITVGETSSASFVFAGEASEVSVLEPKEVITSSDGVQAMLSAELAVVVGV